MSHVSGPGAHPDCVVKGDAPVIASTKKLRICVAGGGGFIGSHLAKRLKGEGIYIVSSFF
jgi:hypothetical protein